MKRDIKGIEPACLMLNRLGSLDADACIGNGKKVITLREGNDAVGTRGFFKGGAKQQWAAPLRRPTKDSYNLQYKGYKGKSISATFKHAKKCNYHTHHCSYRTIRP